MRNSTQYQFESIANITEFGDEPYLTYSVSDLIPDVEYQFVYRGVNEIGGGWTSPVGYFYTRPGGMMGRPKVYFNYDKVVVEMVKGGLTGFDSTKASNYYEILFTNIREDKNPSV